MNKHLKKGLAFLLACALSFGELLPVSAAELSVPVETGENVGADTDEVPAVEKQNAEEIPAEEASAENVPETENPEEKPEESENGEEPLQTPEETILEETVLYQSGAEDGAAKETTVTYSQDVYVSANETVIVNVTWPRSELCVITMDDGIQVEAGEGVELYKEFENNGKKYFCFSVERDQEYKLSVTNTTEGRVGVPFGNVDNSDIGREELQINKDAKGKTPYLSFQPREYGFYIFTGTEGTGSLKIGSDGRNETIEDFQREPVFFDTGDRVSGWYIPAEGETYQFRKATDEDFTVVNAAEQTSVTIKASEEAQVYKFTALKSGYIISDGDPQYQRWWSVGPAYGQNEYWAGKAMYSLDGKIRSLWNTWDELPSRIKITGGKDYYVSIKGSTKEIHLTVDVDKQINVLDYDYFQAFVASGGSVTITDNGQVEIKDKGTMTDANANKAVKMSVFDVTRGALYTEEYATAFAPGNQYWKSSVGAYAASDFYRLKEVDGKYVPEEVKSDTSIQEGDIVLVQYKPDIVWAQSLTLKAPTAKLEPGDTMSITPVPDYGTKQSKNIYTPADTSYGETIYTWKSSDESVATVDEEGNVTAKKAGTFTITATADEALRKKEKSDTRVTASVKLTVADPSNATLKAWNPVYLEPKLTVNYSFTTSGVGDYLIPILEDVNITVPENLPDDVTYLGTVRIPYIINNTNAKLGYACFTVKTAEKRTLQFTVKNNSVQQKYLELATSFPQENQIGRVCTDLNVDDPVTLKSTAENKEDVYYYGFYAPKLGIYSIEGTKPRWVRGENGEKLDPDNMVLRAEDWFCFSYMPEEDTTFTIKKDDSSELKEATDPTTGKGTGTGTLQAGTKYLYEGKVNGTIIAFTSRLEEGEVVLEYTDDTGTHTWNYDSVTGNYSMPVKKGQIYSLTMNAKARSAVEPVTVALPGYSNPKVSSSFKISSLGDADLKGVGSASRMSATYTGKTDITASGTLKWIQNGMNTLKTEDPVYKAGYFLAFRMNVQQKQFKEGGYVSVSYVDGDKNLQKTFYEAADLPADGNLDVILDMNQDLKNVQIRVAVDAKTNITTYNLNLENVKTEEKGGLTGVVTESVNSFGIKTSSPVIKNAADDSVDVVYNSAAWSTGVTLPGNAESGKTASNYTVLRVEVPDSMKNTEVECKVETEGSSKVVYSGVFKDENAKDVKVREIPYLLIVLDAAEGLKETVTLTWSMKGEDGSTVGNSATQKIHVETAEGCYIETIPAEAVLPKSIAFNGLVGTMYVGQSQNAAVTINKKYEEDKVRLSYSTSDNSILSVNRVTGKIDALKAGTATITVEAVMANGGVISKSSKITVKNLTAPGSVKITDIKDTSVTVNWGKNVTGQKFEVYAVPYAEAYDANTRKAAAAWKVYIEAQLDSGKDLPEGWIQADDDKVTENGAPVKGLKAETDYLFYVRNMATAEDGTVWYMGTLSVKTATKKAIFDSMKLAAWIQGTDGADTEVPLTNGEFVVTDGRKLGENNLPNKISYQLLDADDKDITEGTVITAVSYKSSNTNVIKVDKNGVLTLGSQAGTAELSVTGKDASGAVQTSDVIRVTVRKVPTALSAKTTTLTIGQSITLKELIAYDIKGSITEIDVDQIDFAKTWEKLEKTGCFVKEGGENDEISGDTVITASALLENNKGVQASGSSVVVDVSLKDEVTVPDMKKATAKATVKVNALAAPAIKSVAVNDTSAVLTFTPSGTVKKWDGNNYYYTVDVKDMVIDQTTTLSGKAEGGSVSGMTVKFEEAPGSTEAKPSYQCTVTGLSANKKYSAVITAHYDVEKAENKKASSAKSFTTKNRLLASDGKIDVKYISLTELKQEADKTGKSVFSDNSKTSGHIYLENNETYVLMAEVSNLARVLETDKLKWTISSGDKGSATIKATASTFEAKLTAVKTGTFTVTAESTVTKEAMATFKVTITPYQSKQPEASENADAIPVAYLSVDWENPFSEEKKKTA